MQSGIQPSEGCDLTIDLGGKTLKSVGPFVGSDNTQTNCFRFMKGTKVTIKNGTIKTSSPEVAILVQNFADELILDNVRLEGAMATQYVLSNNFGNVVIKNGSVIKAKGGHVAFDAHYGLSSDYDDGVTVEIADKSVTVTGLVEYTKESGKSEEDFLAKTHIYIPTGYSLTAPEGFVFKATADGKKQELVKQ